MGVVCRVVGTVVVDFGLHSGAAVYPTLVRGENHNVDSSERSTTSVELCNQRSIMKTTSVGKVLRFSVRMCSKVLVEIAQLEKHFLKTERVVWRSNRILFVCFFWRRSPREP